MICAARGVRRAAPKIFPRVRGVWQTALMDAAASSSACTTTGVILVEVRMIGGALVAQLAAAAGETVGSLKQRVLAHADPGYHQSSGRPRLVMGCTPLQESRRLNECLDSSAFTAEGVLVLNLVCPWPSSLAAHVEHLERHGSELNGASDVADAVFQAENAFSVRCQPQAAAVTHALPKETRAQVVAWLGMACEATLIDDTLLHGAVLTLDRYAASCGEPVDEMRLLRLSLASLCTEMKLTNEDDFPSGHWQRVLLHLSQGRELLPGVLEAEADMLRRLRFVVGVPTPLTFLNGLALRLSEPPQQFDGSSAQGRGRRLDDGRPGPTTRVGALCLVLARLLTELALYDADLEYRYYPAVLAAGALGAALLAVGPEVAGGGAAEDAFAGTGLAASEEAGAVQAPEAVREVAALTAWHETLFDDLASYCPGVSSLDGMVCDAELDLLFFWQECLRSTGRMNECYTHLRHRHVRSARAAEVLEPWGDVGRGGTALLALSPEAGLERYFACHNRPATRG
uniref:Uncharacterized protein n=1 Tax=Pyrodinium bahamense TaxID=73915 RepID=A0A7R9ZYV8_9DINO|mmetsp:Transcript_15562/g.43001  ORF Transcript_15562/g.43001 Transcript_15562/m.43001 type:complete len:514 (+) Transcript_15562:3-1544(+)